MTTTLIGVGSCYLLTALGLQPARRVGRIVLAGGGVATLLIATFQLPQRGYSLSHALAVILASVSMCAWPALSAYRRHWAPLLNIPVGVTAAVVTVALTMWFALEAHHADVGLAERCAATAAALWPFPVVATTRRALADNRTLGGVESPASASRSLGGQSGGLSLEVARQLGSGRGDLAPELRCSPGTALGDILRAADSGGTLPAAHVYRTSQSSCQVADANA